MNKAKRNVCSPPHVLRNDHAAILWHFILFGTKVI